MKKTLFILISLLALGQVATAQNFNITGAGARAEGMAGAFIGVADDATALVWNPAGVATLERPEASLVTRYVSNSLKFSDGSWQEDDSHGVLNFSSVAYPLTIGGRNMVVAAAYQRQIDLNHSSQGGRNQGGVDSFTGGFGLRLSPLVSIGAAANVWFGNMEVETPFDWSSSGDDEYENHDYSGINANLGVLIDMEGAANPMPLRIGLCVRTPFTLADEGSIVYSSGGARTNEGTFASDWDMPLMAGVGASYRFGDNLTLAADFETRLFGDSKVAMSYTDPLSGDISAEFDLSDHKENLNEYRIGAEYLLVRENGIFPLRMGFRNAPSLYTDYDDAGDPAGQVIGSSVSLGTGIILDRMSFDVSATVTTYEQAYGSLVTLEATDTILSASGIFYF